MYNALKKTILGICGFGFLCTLILLVVFRGNMDVYRANVFSVSNAILLIPGLCLIALIVLINRKHGDMVEAFLKKNTVILLVITLVLLLAVRLIISYEGYFSPGWDAKVILDTTTSIVKGTEIANYDYYSRFPNNILIVWLFSGIGKIAALCGIDTIGYALLAFQSMVCTAGVLLVFLITKGLSNSIKTAWLAYAIAYIIVGLSP